jgi:hypothetical protein
MEVSELESDADSSNENMNNIVEGTFHSILRLYEKGFLQKSNYGGVLNA